MKIFLGFICLALSFSSTDHCLADDGGACLPASMNFNERDFNSQASQDEFVYTLLYKILDKKDKGFYLEVGAGLPRESNNSFFFEKNFCWDGVSLDITPNLPEIWYGERQNLLLIEDATTSDYGALLASFPAFIDYLSLDIDNYYDVVLNRIPTDSYAFKVITIEHDFYHLGDWFRKPEREILTGLGYHLLCPDVMHPAVGSFEDWWIHPSAFPSDIFSTLTALDLSYKDHKEIVKIINNAFADSTESP